MTKTKEKYKQRSLESKIPLPLHGPRTLCTTPFSKTQSLNFPIELKKQPYSISPIEPNLSFRERTGFETRISMRKRSPSSVITGKVPSFRNKFEDVPIQPSNNNTSTIPRAYQLKSREPKDMIGQNSSPFLDASTSRLPTISRGASGSKPFSVTCDTSASCLPTPTRKSQTNLTNKSNVNSAQPKRSNRFPPSAPPSLSEAATRNRVNYLRCTLPRKVKGETSLNEFKSSHPFYHNHS